MLLIALSIAVRHPLKVFHGKALNHHPLSWIVLGVESRKWNSNICTTMLQERLVPRSVVGKVAVITKNGIFC